MVEIVSGAGTKTAAKVNSTNELLVRSTSRSEEQFSSLLDSQTYIAAVGQGPNTTLTLLNTEGGKILFLKNTGAEDLIVNAIIVSSSIGGAVLTISKNEIEGTVTQNDSIIPSNLNFGSTNVSNTTAQVWDETNGNGIQGLSGGVIARTIIMPPAINIDTRGTIIITQGQSLTLAVQNDTGSTLEIECGFRFHVNPTNT